jgi:hypothetical protein
MGGLMGLFPEFSGPASTIEAVLILCGIVSFHELGHFSAARFQGIHVSKFAIGFGPTLWSYKPGEVEYSLRALPLGGFVAFPDNDEDCPYPEDDPNLLKNRPILDRLIVISAGALLSPAVDSMEWMTGASARERSTVRKELNHHRVIDGLVDRMGVIRYFPDQMFLGFAQQYRDNTETDGPLQT